MVGVLLSAAVWISVLSQHDLGQLARGSFEVPGEDFLRALVGEPEAVVSQLVGSTRDEWTSEQAALVRDLAAAPDDKARGVVKRRLPALVPGRFRGERRTIAECESRQIVGHDFDAVVADSFDDAAARVRVMLPDRFLALHTTATERNADGTWRLRAFELLDRAATPDEWERRVKPHMRSIGEHDAQALDVARLLYLPLRTAGYRFAVFEGPRTVLDSLQSTSSLEGTGILQLPVSAAAQLSPQDDSSRRRVAAAQLLGVQWPAKGRHAAQLALAGALRRDGWSPEAALDFLCDVCRAAGDEDADKRAATIAHTWSTAANVTGWRELEKHVDVGIVGAVRGLVDRDGDAKRELAALAAPAAQPAPSLPLVAADAPPASPGQLDEIAAKYKITWGGWAEDVAPPTYVVRPFIPTSTVGMIVAKGSSLKTWMLLSIGIAVATGMPWLGAYPVESCKVLLIDFEEGRWVLQQRLQALLGKQDCPNLAHANFPNARLDDPEFWQDIARFVHANGIKFVGIDSFAAGTPGLDENDRRAADPLVYAGRFAEGLGCSVLFLHHGKKGEGGDERDQVRGTGAIYAGLDWSYALIPQDEDRKRMVVRCIKPCGPRPDDIRIALTVDAKLVLDNQVDFKAEDRAVEQRILAELSKGPVATLHKLERALGVKSGALKDHLKALETRRDIGMFKGRGYDLDTATARRGRIAEAVGRGLLVTPAQVAAAAQVDRDVVDEEIAKGNIARSYPDGPFSVVSRPVS